MTAIPMIDWLIEELFANAILIGCVVALGIFIKIRGAKLREEFPENLREISYVWTLGGSFAAGLAFVAVSWFELDLQKLRYFREQLFAMGVVSVLVSFLELWKIYRK